MEKIVLIFQYLENIKGNFQASNIILSIFKCSVNIRVAAVNATGDAQIAILKNSWRFVKWLNFLGKFVIIFQFLENVEENF